MNHLCLKLLAGLTYMKQQKPKNESSRLQVARKASLHGSHLEQMQQSRERLGHLERSGYRARETRGGRGREGNLAIATFEIDAVDLTFHSTIEARFHFAASCSRVGSAMKECDTRTEQWTTPCLYPSLLLAFALHRSKRSLESVLRTRGQSSIVPATVRRQPILQRKKESR